MNKVKKYFLGLSLSFMSLWGLSFPFKTPSTVKNDTHTLCNQLIENSNNFAKKICPFPISTHRVQTLVSKNYSPEKIEKQAQNVHPIIHKRVLKLVADFLGYKKKYGSSIEQALYTSMNETIFIHRLLTKRPLVFVDPQDHYLLRNGVSGHGGFEKIGTPEEKSPLILEEYLSYDEMCVSAFIGMATPTYFINSGTRINRGIRGIENTYEKEGIYVGLIGARFQKPGYMEWQHMIITPEQNTNEHGYGLHSKKISSLTMWETLYEFQFATFQEALEDTSRRFYNLTTNEFNNPQHTEPAYTGGNQLQVWGTIAPKYLDTWVYKKRLMMVIEPFLLYADQQRIRKKKLLSCCRIRSWSMENTSYTNTINVGSL